MSTPSAAELTLLRTRPQETELWLSIYKPKTKLACQVNNASIAVGYHVIAYNNVTEGSYLDVYCGMTVYVGTTSGGKDVGRIRLKAADASHLYLAENSDINWQDDLYLTVVDYYEINAMYPRMVADLADPTIQTWYKDWDIAYTNQNSLLGSSICMGSHYAGFIEPDSGICDVYYSASGTLSFELPNSNYSCEWIFGGGNPTGSSANTPGKVEYSTPGHYTTRITVTNNNTGAIDVSFRHISIYDRPENGTNVPILNWELVSLDGSRDNGGYQARIKIREDISDIVDGALVVIFADDRYGTTKQSIGGSSLNRQSIFFVGYILDGSISYNYKESSAEFTVGSPTEMMKLTECFAVSVESSSDPAGEDAVNNDIPSAWALLKDMNCRRAMYHYLKWHSTVMCTTDFVFEGTDKYIQFFDADRENLYDAVNNLMQGTLHGNLTCDRQGRLHAEVGIDATDNAASTFNLNMNVDKQDWMESPTIEETYNETVGYMEVGGIHFTPAPTGTFEGTYEPYLSCAPGTSPAYRGGVQKIEGLALNSQADLNALAGNLFAYMNSRYAHVSLKLSGNYRNFDIAPQEIVRLSVSADDTPMGIVWNNKAFHITEMSWEYNPRLGTLIPSLTLHEVTQGYAGATITIPPVPPTIDPGGGGYDIPPIDFPELPPFTGFLYIYHNGVFVAIVTGLNFVDS